MKKIIFNTLIFTLLFSIGCNNSNENPDNNPEIEEFEINQLLADATNNIILRVIADFNADVNTFNEMTIAYLNTPTEIGLEELRTQWTQTAISYEKTYVFHIGVARDRFLHNATYNWPTIPDAIESFIINNEITQETVNAISPQIKAMAGIEYLLFKSDITTNNEEFTNDAKRRELLRLSSEFIVIQADRLFSIWNPNNQNYADTFINNEATGVRASFNLFFNGLNNVVDVAKVSKIGKPGGFETSSIVNPNIVQAPFSNISLELLKANIDTLEEAFFSENNTNISDYLFFILKDNSLSDDIQVKINEVQAAISTIDVPLVNAVISNSDQVENLHTKLTELLVLLSVDTRSALSVIITATDNDGD